MPEPKAGDRLSAEDAVFLYLEKPEMPLHIGSVGIFDGPVPFEKLIALVESKLPLLTRYRQRLVIPPLNLGHPTWEWDPDFNIRRHFRQVSLKRGTQAELEDIVGDVFTHMMDRNRPLWDITLVDGLKSGQTAMIARVHHCLVDGVAGVGLLKVILDPTPRIPRLPRRRPFQAPPLPDPKLSAIDALLSSSAELVERILSAQSAALNIAQVLASEYALPALQQLLGFLPDMMASLDRLPFNAPVGGPRKHIWTEMPLQEIEAIREKCGAKLNDVILTINTLAVQRYAELHGQSVKGRLLRYMVPVNLRPPTNHPELGNRISMLPITTRLDIKDPLALLKDIHERTSSMKHSLMLELVRLGANWFGAAPVPYQVLFGQLGNVLPIPVWHMVCTNVPGPPMPLYLLGRKMLTAYPYVPIGNDMGFCVAVQSYDGKLFFGLTADCKVLPDVHRLRDLFDEVYADLRKATGVRTRRKPRVAVTKPKAAVHKTNGKSPEPMMPPQTEIAAAAATVH